MSKNNSEKVPLRIMYSILAASVVGGAAVLAHHFGAQPKAPVAQKTQVTKTSQPS